MFELSDRLKKLPPYVFARINKIKQEEMNKGRKLISLGMGDPDLPTPNLIVQAMCEAAQKNELQKYPSYWGLLEFRKTVANWYKERFGVKLDSETEVLTLIGSKEGIAHLPLAFVNPGDATLVPDPAYPVYYASTLFAGGDPLIFSLTKKNEFLPDFGELENLTKKGKVKILFLNYPNNPTAASATKEFFKEVVAFAKKHQILVCHDNAYSEIYYNGKRQPSFLEVPGAIDVGCEFHSLSKTFNMTGFRIGFVVGNKQVIDALAQVKTNIDSGVFNAIQMAGITALRHYQEIGDEVRAVYQRRMDLMIPAVRAAGLECEFPQATFYIWAKIPSTTTSENYVLELIQKKGIVITPGSGFGRAGEGYVRFTTCVDESTLKKVAEEIKK